MEDVALKIR